MPNIRRFIIFFNHNSIKQTAITSAAQQQSAGRINRPILTEKNSLPIKQKQYGLRDNLAGLNFKRN